MLLYLYQNFINALYWTKPIQTSDFYLANLKFYRFIIISIYYSMQRSFQVNSSKSRRQNSYRKDKGAQKEGQLTYKEEIASKYTNLAFKVSSGIQKFTTFIKFQEKKQYCTIFLQGKKIASQKEALQELSKIIWFTYRKIPQLSETLNSDTSWGCLIRVGQMALAASLKKYFLLKGKYNEKEINTPIIYTFLDDRGAQEKYSLTKIVSKANSLNKQKKIGDWFNTSQICQVLCELHNSDPMKGSQNLKLLHFTNSIIFLKQIYEMFGCSMCKCSKRRVICRKCHTLPKQEQISNNQIQTFYTKIHDPSEKPKTQQFNSPPKQNNEKHVLVMVSTRLGLEGVNAKYYESVLQFLQLNFCLGIIGGIPRKGLFFVGSENDKLVYLDPHLVQEEVTKSNFRKCSETFSCRQLRTVGRQAIDTSMAFLFYLQNLSDLAKLKDKVQKMKENGFLGIEWENIFENSYHNKKEDEDSFIDLRASFIA